MAVASGKTKIIEWKTGGGAADRAFVIVPSELKGPTGVGIWLHSAVGSPDEIATEAMTYCERGYLAILLDAPYSSRRLNGAKRGPDNSGEEARLWRCTAWELSRLLDRAQNEYPIDTEKSFAVGFNLGGSQIARWMKDDTRIRRAIIAGSVPELSRYWLESDHPVALNARASWPKTLAGYAERTREMDLTESVLKLGGARLLFQFGTSDAWIERKSVERLGDRLRARHKIEWVQDGHDMRNLSTARRRRYWLNGAIEGTREERIFESWRPL